MLLNINLLAIELHFNPQQINMYIYVKHMLCDRCKLMVSRTLKKMGLHFVIVNLGEVRIKENITKQQRLELKITLHECGLELMDDKEAMLIEKIKKLVIETIYCDDDLPKINFSLYLSQQLSCNYTYLSNLFSKIEGTTLEHFIVLQKIERVKKLIIYDELNLTEIAWKLNYSSVAHLSTQFKKITGSTPSLFKILEHRKQIEFSNQ